MGSGSTSFHLERKRMSQTLHRPDRFFFGTRSMPCPYVDGKVEQKVVTDLSGKNSKDLYMRLSRAGFRRSHGLAYRPACAACQSCVPVRINVGGFKWSKSFRRTRRSNSDLQVTDLSAIATVEQFQLFFRYQRSRHGGGEMAAMSFKDYRAMVEDSPVDTRIVEFRDSSEVLIGVMLCDLMEDSYSAVYSFFDPDLASRSLGTFMVLWLVERAAEQKLCHIYLGYWIDGSGKMDYKARFRPLEQLRDNRWGLLSN
jgi:arginine-tRNA-protein transferase